MHFKPHILFEEGLCSSYIFPFLHATKVYSWFCYVFGSTSKLKHKTEVKPQKPHTQVQYLKKKMTKKSTWTYKKQKAEQNKLKEQQANKRLYWI